MKISVLSRILLVVGVMVILTTAARTNTVPLLMLKQAQQFQAAKEHSKAIDLYEDLTALRPEWPEPHIALGEICVAQGRWDEATDLWHQAIRENHSSLYPFVELAKYYEHRARDFERAEKLVLRAIELVDSAFVRRASWWRARPWPAAGRSRRPL